MQKPKWVTGPQQFITIKDAANFLGCSPDTIYRYIDMGPPKGIPAKKIPFPKLNSSGRHTTYLIPKIPFLNWAGFEFKGDSIDLKAKQHISTKEAADLIGCDITTIRKYIKRGPPLGIPAKKIEAPTKDPDKTHGTYLIPTIPFLEWAGFDVQETATAQMETYSCTFSR
jgi:predicted DNA-binding transcriptional regulator AlpA